MASKHRKKSRAAKKIAVMGAATATAAALTAGLVSPIPEILAGRNDSTLIPPRVEQWDVQLTAVPGLPDIVGIYGVGPVFWVADLLGLTPENLILTAAGLVGNPELTAAVQQLLTLIEAVSPVEVGVKGPLPSDVFDAVNGLEYSASGLIGLLEGPVTELLGAGAWELLSGFVEDLIAEAPILNQRRAIIFSESLGGLTTSLAYRDMINAVQSNDPEWGNGVTGQWLIFLNNPSRPGGGLFALATPFTNLFGLNLTTPDAGSYTNEEVNGGQITKVLNTSILDITWAYNLLSDAPTTLNPLSWANAAAGSAFITYLIPDNLDFSNTNLASHVLPQLVVGLADGAKVMLDLTGGQGLELLPFWGQIVQFVDDIDVLDLGWAAALEEFAETTKLPGTATYITYDSGNLPLLEPFDLVPRLLGLLGVDVPQPVIGSIEDALRMAVNTGYQDVDPTTLERTFAQAGEQAYLWHSALKPSEQFRAGWTITNELVDDVQSNLLNPVAWTPSIAGQPDLNAALKAIIQNQLAMTLSGAVNGGINALQAAANPAFDDLEDALKPALDIADDATQQAEDAIDNALGVDQPSQLSSTSGFRLSESAATISVVGGEEKRPDGDLLPAPDIPAADGAEQVKSELPTRLEKRRTALKEARTEVEDSVKAIDAAAKRAQTQADKNLKKARAQLNDIAEKGRKDVERAVGGADVRTKKGAAKPAA